MLGLSWTELLVIGVVALIVIGPKDLPIMMRRIGEFVGQVRRMGGEFQRELQKAAAIDEIKDLRKSVTEPLRQANADITSQFNKMTSTGVTPTGALKPTDAGVESVADAIKAQAGMPISAPVPATPAVAGASGAAVPPVAITSAPPPSDAPVAAKLVQPTPPAAALSALTGSARAAPRAEAPAAVAAKPKAKRVTKLKPVDDTVVSADLPSLSEAAPAARPARAPRSAAAAKPAATKTATTKTAAAKPAAAKPKAKPAKAKAAEASAAETVADATKPARKPRVRKAT